MKRKENNPNYQWDLTKLFPTDEDWRNEYESLMKDLDDFIKYEGQLSSSGDLFLTIINKQMEIQKRGDLVYMYGIMKYYQDTGDTEYADIYSKSHFIKTKSISANSFIKPEILAMGEEKVNSFISSTKGLELYKHDFDNIFRRAKHTLSEKEEKSLAEVKAISTLPVNLYNLLNNNEIKFENAVDKVGNKIEITPGKFKNLMSSPDRVIRESTYNSVFGSYTEMKEIFAGVYAGNIKNEAYFAKARGYKSSQEAYLFENNMPVEFYQNLITTVGNGLEAFQKYFGLVKKVLGLEILKPYDLNAPIFAESKKVIKYEEGKILTLESIAILGDEYVDIAKNIFDSKIIDVYENKGKIGGAFSFGAYGMDPYIIMSYNDDLKSLFTLTHELGHSMHTQYRNANQPFVYAGCTMLTAETAATTHEALLADYLIKTTEDKNLKAALLNNQIQNFIVTFFRQSMFAEFEMKSHGLGADALRMDADFFSSIWKEGLQKFFGEHLEIDDKIINEWARIPHLHNSPFYVYQYPTGFAAASAIAKGIIDNGQSSADKFINMLKSGSSEYSLPLLKKAGVDMSTPKPIKDALAVFASLVDQLERLII